MAEGKGRVKGAWLVDSVKAYLTVVPDARACLGDAFAALPPSLRPGFNPTSETFGLLPASWYPEEMLQAAVAAMTRDLDEAGRDKLARQLSAAVAQKTLRGIYRVFFRLLATPQRFCEHVERLWSTSHDSGALTARLVGPRVVEVRVDDWRGHDPFVCKVNNFIGLEIFRAMGLKNVKNRVECRSATGGRVCVTYTTWD